MARRFQRSNGDVIFMRAALVVIFAAFGYAKWFDYEAQGLVPLIGNSPLLSWMHQAFGTAAPAMRWASLSGASLVAAGGILVAAAGVAGGDRFDGDLPDYANADLFTPGPEPSAGGFSGHGRRHQLFNSRIWCCWPVPRCC